MTAGKNKRVIDESLDLMTKRLDDYYIENKLRCLCEQINRKHIINTEYVSAYFIEYVEKKILTIDSPTVNIYYNIYKMLTAENKELYFVKVNELIKVNLDMFSMGYTKEIYDRLMNFCIRKMNNGQTIFASKYLNYVDILSKRNLFLDKGKLSALRYKNCIAISLVAENIGWAENFLESNATHLEHSVKNSAYMFNKAQIQFYQEKYEDCHKSLVGFHSFDMYYKIAYDKLILMLSYYLLLEKKYDPISYQKKIESLRKYLQIQKKLSEEKKSNMLFFLRVLSKLIKNKKVDLGNLLRKTSIMDYLWFKNIYNKKKWL